MTISLDEYRQSRSARPRRARALPPTRDWYVPAKSTPSRLSRIDAQVLADMDSANSAATYELAHCDTTASILMLFPGLMLTGLSTALQSGPPSVDAALPAVLAATLLLAALGILACLVVMARRARAEGTGISAYAACDSADEVVALFMEERPEDRRASHLRQTSQLTVRKYRRVRAAMLLMVLAVPFWTWAMVTQVS
ncbi:hypothetical protein OHA25_60615 (plasmid) [Nonomuraea sp. NBC_00507]|uniref:Pycsar system effector family protein n=1 Tax=Nonomuraea sp. NBC_00507 TaxID=2976002 RepID=UPI002E186F64